MRAVAVTLLLWSGSAWAARVVVRGDSLCPSPAQVQAALHATEPELELGEPADHTAEVVDRGATYAVTLDGVARSFEDADRACLDRAAKVAVVIALDVTTEPHPQPKPQPQPKPNPEPPPEPEPESKPPVALSKPARISIIELQVRGLFAAAPAQSSSVTGGGGVRLYLGTRYVGAFAGVAGIAPTTLTFADASAKLWRVPFELGARGRFSLNQVTLSLDGALVLGPLITEGLDLTSPTKQTRLEVALEATARVAYAGWRPLAPFVEIGVEGLLKQYDLTVPGVGDVGHPPRVWLNVAAGLAIAIR